MSRTDDLRRLMDCERRLADQTKADAWPEGVIARYLTVGGATVDIVVERPGDEEPYTIATCQGCSWFDISSWDYLNGYLTQAEAGDEAFGKTKKAAQDHASTCRAVPKPGGAQ